MKKQVTIKIDFDKLDSHNEILIPGCISKESLQKAKIAGKIQDYEITHDGIMVIKKMKLESVSI